MTTRSKYAGSSWSIAGEVALAAVRGDKPATNMLIEEVISDCQGGDRGWWLQTASQVASVRSVRRYVDANLRGRGRCDLLPRPSTK